MFLITGLLRHVFQHNKTGERLYVYRVRGDVVYGVVFGANEHKARRVYLDTLARDWSDIGDESPRIVIAIADLGGVADCGDDDCPVHGTGADRRKPVEERLN